MVIFCGDGDEPLFLQHQNSLTSLV